MTYGDIEEIIQYLNNDYVSGITFSGGHPLEHYNIDYVECLAQLVKRRCPGKTIWLYTGLELDYKKIINDSKLLSCLSFCDVVVDGPYVQSLRDTRLAFRGSSNQRLIDISETLKQKKIILWKE